ncbi:hypothetical protein BH23VER1_BH23VER1_10170 [soil metagenome]
MIKQTEDMPNRLLALGLAGALALGLAACGDQGATTSPDPSPGDAGTPAATGREDPVIEGGVPLEPEFPKPMFIGTPQDADLPNLEPEGTDPKLSIMVEEGTELISAGAPVTGSDDLPTIGELDYVTDGDKDGGDGYYVELGPGLQWVQIDLGESRSIQAVAIWHFHKNARAYKDVVVQVSDDPEFADGVTTIYNNDHDNSAGQGVGEDFTYIETNHGRLISGRGAEGQYVRLYSNGNTTDDLNHYVEVEVYGKSL